MAQHRWALHAGLLWWLLWWLLLLLLLLLVLVLVLGLVLALLLALLLVLLALLRPLGPLLDVAEPEESHPRSDETRPRTESPDLLMIDRQQDPSG
jgi:hypothetical protein